MSKWYGDIVAVADVSFACAPGVTGLLGPNGAGKTTTLKLLTGLLKPSLGEALILGRSPRQHPEVFRSVGVVLDGERLYTRLKARAYVRLHADLHGLDAPEERTERALEELDVLPLAARRLGTLSKGQRQRVKLAGAIVNEPRLLVLDEPMSGLDPVQRSALIELVQRVQERGATVIVSSHILEEVEQLASRVLVLVNGRLAASGDVRGIRALLAERRPFSVRIRSDGARRLAAGLLHLPSTVEVKVDSDLIEARSRSLEALSSALPALARDLDVSLDEVETSDESLEEVFHLLVRR